MGRRGYSNSILNDTKKVFFEVLIFEIKSSSQNFEGLKIFPSSFRSPKVISTITVSKTPSSKGLS
jgi:hypothetical protein